MSDVFREVTLNWKGKDYTLVASVTLLRRIKAKGINNLTLARECIHGGADPAELAVAHTIFMRAAGAHDVTEDVSYAFLTGGDTAGVIAFQSAYVCAVLPAIDLGKKPEAPAPKASKPRARKKKAT